MKVIIFINLGEGYFLEKKLFGVIDVTNQNEELNYFNTQRSLAAIPFGGRYRLIDFILSSMVNAGIIRVGIFLDVQYRSLMNHLESGKNWDLNRKQGGLYYFPTTSPNETLDGIGNFKHFEDNIDFFYKSKQDYVLIANGLTISNIDFKKILNHHIQYGYEITSINDIHGKPLQMFIINKNLLIRLVETRKLTGYSCLMNVVNDKPHVYKICNYKYEGYAKLIDSVKSYYDANMDLLNMNIWKKIFLKERPIYTNVRDEPPTRYAKGSQVKNSMIANGCQIEGTVENSIIGRSVTIEKGAVVKNSIIMDHCHIASNTVLEKVILDKNVIVKEKTMLFGAESSPFVACKGRVIQGELIKS